MRPNEITEHLLSGANKVYLKNNVIPWDWLELPANKNGSDLTMGNLKIKGDCIYIREKNGYYLKDLNPGYVPIFYNDTEHRQCQIQVQCSYVSLTPWSEMVAPPIPKAIKKTELVKISIYDLEEDNNSSSSNKQLKSKKDGRNISKVRRPHCAIRGTEEIRASSLARNKS
tara:strand:- start:38919 stop:39428 length:510 start_codon:yes stop_codon:yes gene_type:complete